MTNGEASITLLIGQLPGEMSVSVYDKLSILKGCPLLSVFSGPPKSRNGDGFQEGYGEARIEEAS